MNKLRVKFISGYDDEGYNDYEWGIIDGYVNCDSHGIEPENCIFAIVATDSGKLKPVHLDKIIVYE